MESHDLSVIQPSDVGSCQLVTLVHFVTWTTTIEACDGALLALLVGIHIHGIGCGCGVGVGHGGSWWGSCRCTSICVRGGVGGVAWGRSDGTCR
jgi:hypothetical protein